MLKKMKSLGKSLGSRITNKEYDSNEVYELIQIENCIPELRQKNKNI